MGMKNYFLNKEFERERERMGKEIDTAKMRLQLAVDSVDDDEYPRESGNP